MIKYPILLLDADETLFDFSRAEGEAISDALRGMGILPDAEMIATYSRINDGFWKMLERGEITRAELLWRRFEQLYEELGLTVSATETQSIYIERLALACPFIDGALEMLEALSREYSLYAVSNGTASVQDGRIERSGIGRYFKKIFISERVGANKPDRLFFERCFSAIDDFSPEKSIIVGDSLTSDILGGKNAGILTCLFNPKGTKNHTEIIPDHEITGLSELPALLRRISDTQEERKCTTDIK